MNQNRFSATRIEQRASIQLKSSRKIYPAFSPFVDRLTPNAGGVLRAQIRRDYLPEWFSLECVFSARLLDELRIPTILISLLHYTAHSYI